MLEKAITESGALLVCSDMYIIDGNGKRTADSITEVRRHHVFLSGEGLAPKLLISNFVTGCTMLLRAESAREAVPFCPYMVHDHYLALWCAEQGKVQSLMNPLIRYRIHGGNQTGLMAGVQDKRSYGRVRIDQVVQRLKWLDEHFVCSEQTKNTIKDGVKWACARQDNWNSGSKKTVIWKYRHFSKIPSIFEIFFRSVSDVVFDFMLFLAKNNWI